MLRSSGGGRGIKIFVKAFPIFKDYMEIDLAEGSKLMDLVDLMISKYPEFRENYADAGGNLDLDVVIMVNNKQVRDLDYTLREGDRIYFIPPVAGG